MGGRVGWQHVFTPYPLPPPPPGSPLDPPCPTTLGSIVRLPPYPHTQNDMLLPYPTPYTNEVLVL